MHDLEEFESCFSPSFHSLHLHICGCLKRAALPPVMPEDKGFHRGSRREGTCQEQSLNTAQTPFQYHLNIRARTPLQSLSGIHHPSPKVYFSHICLSCENILILTKCEEKSICINMIIKRWNEFST